MDGGIYERLMEASSAAHSAEDRHVLASIVAIAAHEAPVGASLATTLGLDSEPLRATMQALFPGAPEFFADQPPSAMSPATVEERSVRDLLVRFRTPSSALAPLLAVLVARRSMRPNHLWQDLGFGSRGELSGLMNRHFAPLARRNSQDMKWKKFFYRMTCSEEGFSLCMVPVCGECSDVSACFGDESGPSLLARASLARGLFSPMPVATM